MIFATDDLLELEVPKGARLLVNEKKTKVDENGCYVFRKTDGGAGFDIAIVELLDDGGTVGDGKLVPPKDPNKKFKIWLPLRTTISR